MKDDYAPKDKLHNERYFVILFYVSDVFANYKGLLLCLYKDTTVLYCELSEDPSLIECYRAETSHNSNPSSAPQVYVDGYSTLGHVGGGNTCGVYTVLRVTATHAG